MAAQPRVMYLGRGVALYPRTYVEAQLWGAPKALRGLPYKKPSSYPQSRRYPYFLSLRGLSALDSSYHGCLHRFACSTCGESYCAESRTELVLWVCGFVVLSLAAACSPKRLGQLERSPRNNKVTPHIIRIPYHYNSSPPSN